MASRGRKITVRTGESRAPLSIGFPGQVRPHKCVWHAGPIWQVGPDDEQGNPVIMGRLMLCEYGHFIVEYAGDIDQEELERQHGPVIRYLPIKRSPLVGVGGAPLRVK